MSQNFDQIIAAEADVEKLDMNFMTQELLSMGKELAALHASLDDPNLEHPKGITSFRTIASDID